MPKLALHTEMAQMFKKKKRRKGRREKRKRDLEEEGREEKKAKRIMNNTWDSCSLECTLALEDYSLNI